MGRTSKAKTQREHAKKRASERYGLEINREIYKNLIAQLQEGKKENARFIENQSRRVTVWALKVNEKWIPVVYDKDRKTIVTFLPHEFFVKRGLIYE